MNFIRKYSYLPSKAVLPSGAQLSRQANRDTLRFDKEFRSSINLETQNLYMCLHCGIVLTGGGTTSQMIAHFGKTGHTLAINLDSHKFVLLPSFDELPQMKELFDIEFACHPFYNDIVYKEVLSKQKSGIRIPGKRLVFPGAMCFDVNPAISSQLSTLRFLTRITPIRDYLLKNEPKETLSYFLSGFMKQFFNPFTFQDLVSPFDVLRSIQELSEREFVVDAECDPTPFLAFILTTLNKEIGKENVASHIRGKISVLQNSDGGTEFTPLQQRFWCLPLDPMESPLYRSGLEKEKIIPRVELGELMERYNGEFVTKQAAGNQTVIQRKMKISETKEFLWLNVNRIRSAVFGKEKLTMHIALPKDGLDLSQYGTNAKYDLVAIIAHEGEVKDGFYVTYIKNEAGVWLQCGITDITVTIEEIATNSQCCHLLYQRK
jgi:uncharacterized UBP type Zn finger protein